MADLNLRLFEAMEVRLGGKPVSEIFTNRKLQALLAYLAVEGERTIGRERLMALLWPGMPENSARHNLRQTLYLLRNLLPEVSTVDGRGSVPLILSDRRGVQIDPAANLMVDARRLEALLKEVLADPANGETALAEADRLYRGDFLSDFYLEDSSEFENWAGARRQAYRGLLLDALERMARFYLDRGELAPARAWAARQIALDPLREVAHRQLMEALARAGSRAEALRQYRELEELLTRELNASPDRESVDLYERICSESGIFSEPMPPAKEAHRQKHNLPAPPTAFIGRQEEMQVLEGMLAEPGVRLVTLVGPGGTGKTRMAVACAARLLAGQKDGAWLVELAPVQKTEEIVPAIARALDFEFYRDENPGGQLLDFLREKQMLLVLDNFEHLRDSASFLSEILAEARGIKLLVTSRVRLNLQVEQLFPLTGMRSPDASEWEDCADPVERVQAFSAVQLFLARARLVQHDFHLDENNVRAVVEICRLVQGMPLGIELAAAWLSLLSVEEIAAEITRSLDFLEADLADLPERQRSLRAVYQSSWNYLNDEERAAFLRLCTFVGSFSRQAAEEVGQTTLRTLLGLANKSWLQKLDNGRFQLHELMRQYGSQALLQDETRWREARNRHAEYFAGFVESQSARMKGKEQVGGLDSMEEEFDTNIKAAWDWLVAERRFDVVVEQFLLGLYQYAVIRDRLGKLIPWLRQARLGMDPEERADQHLGFLIISAMEVYFEEFTANTDANPMARFAAIWQQIVQQDMSGQMGFWFVLYAALGVSKKIGPEAGLLLDAALERLVPVFDQWELGLALMLKGGYWTSFSIEEDKFLEAARIYEQLGVFYELGVAYVMLGNNANLKNYRIEEITTYLHKAQKLFSAVGERFFQVSITRLLALSFFKRGLVEEGLSVYANEKPAIERMGNIRMMAELLHWESLDALRYSTIEYALETRLKCLELTRKLNVRSDIYWRTCELGDIYRVAGENEKAAHLFEEADAGFQIINNSLGRGYVQRGYGDMAMEAGRYEEALSHYLAFQSYVQTDNPDWSIAQSHAKLAVAYAGLGNCRAARREMRNCLALTANLSHQELEVIALLAEPICLIQAGAYVQAVELAALIREHKSSWNETRYQAEKILLAASEALAGPAAQAAVERGKAMDLKTVTRTLLAQPGK